MFRWCTNKNEGLFEVGGEGVLWQEGVLVIHGSSLGGGLKEVLV